MVSAKPFPNGPRSMSCKLAQMGPSSITFLWLWPATDHEPHCRHVSIDGIWRRTESTPRSGWWRSHMVGIYSDCSTREMKWIVTHPMKTQHLSPLPSFPYKGYWTQANQILPAVRGFKLNILKYAHKREHARWRHLLLSHDGFKGIVV